jgi:putative phosphoesterase
MMKIAVLSDIHANIHALEAVWDDLVKQKPDAVYCLGDLVGYGAFPNEVISFIRDHEIPTVMGNYDEGVDYDLPDCGCIYRDPFLSRMGDLSLRWSREVTHIENKRFLQSLPIQIRLDDRRLHLLFVHGSPRKINEYLYEDRPQATFERIAKLAGCDVLLFGHTHLPYQKRVAETLFVNAGTIGKPRDGDSRAGYVLLSLKRHPKVEFRRVAYDVESASRSICQSGLPHFYADVLETSGLEKVDRSVYLERSME